MPMIRKAQPSDIAECVRIRGLTRENAVSEARLASLGITVASWSQRLALNKLVGHICTEGDRMLGYCFGDTQTGEIVVLALVPNAEGRGLGRRLLFGVVADLRALGHRRMFLGCSRDSSTRSYGFYRHLGWTSTGEIDGNDDEILELADRSSSG